MPKDINKYNQSIQANQENMRNRISSGIQRRAGIVSGSTMRWLNSNQEVGDVLPTIPTSPSLEEVPEKPKTLAEWFAELKQRLQTAKRDTKPKIFRAPIYNQRTELIEDGGSIK